MAGNSFMVTVSAPKAPWAQTHSKVSSGQPGCTMSVVAPARWRRHWRQVASVSTRISTPTPVAR